MVEPTRIKVFLRFSGLVFLFSVIVCVSAIGEFSGCEEFRIGCCVTGADFSSIPGTCNNLTQLAPSWQARSSSMKLRALMYSFS